MGEGVPVVPRGAGTSLAGGALPTADCVILGTMRLREVLEIDTDNRYVRVQTGVTNLSVSAELEPLGFFYAPDPSSQLACTIAGNIAMNSGGAHCLKYGVTTNNLLGATVVLMDGTVVELGGPMGEAQGLDLLGVICGSEGQLGVVTEATLRILPKPAGARPVLIGFDSSETAGACVAAIIRAGNMSLGVNLLAGLTRRVAAALGEDWDIEIVETHHRMKVDAPSGTALLLGEAAARGRGIPLEGNFERGRDGITGKRAPGAIGFASLRGGTVAGDHSVHFLADGERVVLSHVAENRTIFARGALRAALWLIGQPPRRYTMGEVLGL